MFPTRVYPDPIVEPVTLAEAKAQCRCEHDAENALIEAQIKGAREFFEKAMNRSLVASSWVLRQPAFLAKQVLPYSPLLTISSVKYKPVGYTSGALTTVASTVYQAVTSREPGELWLRDGQTWPATLTDPEAVEITWTTGAATQVIKQAILLMVGHWYRNREAVGPEQMEIPLGAESLISISRVTRF